MSAEDALLDTEQAAKFVNVGINQFRALVRAKKVPFIKLGPRTIRFYRPALEEWAKQMSQLAG